MALDSASVLLLSAAKSIGADFSDVMMVGRQAFGPRAKVLARVFATFGIEQDARAFVDSHKYADRFFEVMGAERVESLDLSGYEGAPLQHDLNLPLPDALRAKYSLVHDGGTLEHVFNIAQALRNCMEMVRPGGHFTQVSCGNNLMGHGFWQLSPEAIYRAFSPANGFQVKAVLLHELRGRKRWVVVADPAEARRRVELMNDAPTYILTIAQRVSDAPVFATFPQQSDYEARWERPGQHGWQLGTARQGRSKSKGALGTIDKIRRRFLARRHDGFSAPFFREVSEDDVMLGRFR